MIQKNQFIIVIIYSKMSTKNIILLFSDGKKYNLVLCQDDIYDQIKNYLLQHTDKRGNMIFLYNGNSNINYSNIEDNSTIDVLTLQQDDNMKQHIESEGMISNGFYICSDIAVSRSGTHVTNIV